MRKIDSTSAFPLSQSYHAGQFVTTIIPSWFVASGFTTYKFFFYLDVNHVAILPLRDAEIPVYSESAFQIFSKAVVHTSVIDI